MIRLPPRSTRTDTPFPTRRSSDLVGEALAPVRDQVVIATKFGFELDDEGRAVGTDSRPEHIRQVADASLRRRSEEHTSELQSLMRISYAVFCLKKKKKNKATTRMSMHQLQYNSNHTMS